MLTTAYILPGLKIILPPHSPSVIFQHQIRHRELSEKRKTIFKKLFILFFFILAGTMKRENINNCFLLYLIFFFMTQNFPPLFPVSGSNQILQKFSTLRLCGYTIRVSRARILLWFTQTTNFPTSQILVVFRNIMQLVGPTSWYSNLLESEYKTKFLNIHLKNLNIFIVCH